MIFDHKKAKRREEPHRSINVNQSALDHETDTGGRSIFMLPGQQSSSSSTYIIYFSCEAALSISHLNPFLAFPKIKNTQIVNVTTCYARLKQMGKGFLLKMK